jgi:Carboxypeptidase regulatory-like domain
MKFSLRIALVGLILARFIVLTGFAQSNEGGLAGTITDPSGNIVVNAAVTATNVATGEATKTTSTATGGYHIFALPVGTYTVSASAPGFKRTDRVGVQIQLETTTALDISLVVGDRK